MIVSKYPNPEQLALLLQRPYIDRMSLDLAVSAILQEVRADGDLALRAYSVRFDGVALDQIEVSAEERAAAGLLVSDELKAAIRLAARNIEAFHEAQRERFVPVETMPGVVCWRKSVPIERVGLYVPGGTAPLFSTVLMLGIPAKVAGCREVVLCTPPAKDGTVHPAILYAAEVAGIGRIFKLGGAQAIAAMAYGTSTVPQVYKVFGPGNRYVTAAKMLVQQSGIPIDMPAGPSELLVFADETCVPAFVAADLLSQAEHDADSQVVLLTTSSTVLDQVMLELERQLAVLPRQNMLQAALAHSLFLLLADRQAVLAAINSYAPEHLILACAQAEELAEGVVNAGSVFIGNFTPEAAGDYASGTNHTLPTSGFARSYSGVSLDSFLKKISFQRIDQAGMAGIGPAIVCMAEAEQLPAHAQAVRLRLAAEDPMGI